MRAPTTYEMQHKSVLRNIGQIARHAHVERGDKRHQRAALVVADRALWLAGRARCVHQRPRVGRRHGCVGLVVGRASGNAAAGYFANLLNWQQDSSWLTLLGGLRGVGTELTWWLAMLGASLATGGGKHINIDAFLRFVPKKLKMPSFISASLATVVVCFIAAWGFFDNIAVPNFGAPRDSTPAHFDRATNLRWAGLRDASR